MGKKGEFKVTVSWPLFEKALAAHIPIEETAELFGMGVRTLSRRIKEHYGISYTQLKAKRSYEAWKERQKNGARSSN